MGLDNTNQVSTHFSWCCPRQHQRLHTEVEDWQDDDRDEDDSDGLYDVGEHHAGAGDRDADHQEQLQVWHITGDR